MTHARHEFERAKRDALSAIARDIPDPKVFARYLTADIADMLVSASFRHSSYYVYSPDSYKLRRMGLMECRGNCLTAFGIRVRRELVDQGA